MNRLQCTAGGQGCCVTPTLSLFDVFSVLAEKKVLEMVNQVLTFQGLIGVLAVPTTVGISERAMGYEEPWDDNKRK